MIFFILAAKPDTGVIALAFILAPVFFFAAKYFYRRWKKVQQTYQLMLDTKPCQVSALSEGPCEFQGKIGNVDPPLVSPWSQQECVYYDFIVIEETGKNAYTVFDDKQTQSFTVTDSSGSVEINPGEGNFHVKIDRQAHSGELNDADSEMQTLLKSRYRNLISTEGWFNPRRYYTERTLAVGDPVYVFGEAKREGGKLVISDGVMPLIISEESQQNSERMHYLPDRNVYVLGMVASGFGAIFFFALAAFLILAG